MLLKELIEAQVQLVRSAKEPTLTGGSAQEGLDRVLVAVTATADTGEAATATAGVAEAAPATADTVAAPATADTVAAPATADTEAVPATAGTAGAASWTMLRQETVQ